MYCEGTADILDAHGCRAATHVFIYTHNPSAADSLQPRDGTQWFCPLAMGKATGHCRLDEVMK